MSLRLLCFDIGGTNCRSAVFAVDGAGRVEPGPVHIVPTEGLRTTKDLHYAAREGLGQAMDGCDACAMAVAGPVGSEEARLSNADLVVDKAGAAARFAMPVTLMNDFAAVARAVDSPAGADAERVRGVSAQAPGPRAVMGAGTGLGCGALPLPGKNVFMASEGGHIPFAFLDDEERRFEAFLLERLHIPFATADDVVTGRGLKALAAFCTGLECDGRTCGRTWLAADVDNPDNRVGRLYARFLGRAARAWALATLCSGGLWIAGGIAVQNRAVVRSRAFADEFVRGRHAAFLEQVPVSLFRDERCGLWGAAMAAQDLVLSQRASST